MVEAEKATPGFCGVTTAQDTFRCDLLRDHEGAHFDARVADEEGVWFTVPPTNDPSPFLNPHNDHRTSYSHAASEYRPRSTGLDNE